MIENNPELKSFIPISPENHFPIQNLPFGIFRSKKDGPPCVGVAIGEMILDLSVLEAEGLFNGPMLRGLSVFNQDNLNAFMALGREAWREARARVSQLLRHDEPTFRDNAELRARSFYEAKKCEMLLPIKVSGYTDFYASKEHATNVGVMFRDKENPLSENWLQIPIGYDGRASSVVVSGTNFHRPIGQIKLPKSDFPIYSESRKLDTEVEVAFIVGTPSNFGDSISVKDAAEHIFGVVLLSDWSARDVQQWEYVPLGPFLSKNFCTSISPWVVMLDALEPFRVAGVQQNPEPLPYLRSSRNWNYDIHLELSLQTERMEKPSVISVMNYAGIYWDFCQQLAHHSMNGCKMQTGDIYGCGTISGPTPNSYGSLLELTWNGKNPIKLPNGEERTFIEDGDKVMITGWCQGKGYRIGFGEVAGIVLPRLTAVIPEIA